MPTIEFRYWEEDEGWLGYLLDFPDHWTQDDRLIHRIARHGTRRSHARVR